jgi:predicted metalloprotease
MALLQQLPQNQPGAGPGAGPGALPGGQDDEMKEFVSVVLADTEDVWNEQFRRQGAEYREPTLVLFTGQVQSACGYASAAVGPFYCPGDEKVYIDLAFYDELQRRFNAPGDFAQAYVIAHEVGHHVQNLMGTSDRVHRARSRVSEEEFNELSVRLELQADFYAGVWAHHANRTRQIIEPGDLEEAIRAASAIGDDRLQMQQQGYVVPDSFTHGTSEQRVRWFRKGYESGDVSEGDTFKVRDL